MTRVSSAPRAPLKQTVQRRAFARARLHGVRSAAIQVLAHPALLVLGLSICLAFLMRAAFFRNAAWLWQFALPVNLRDITPWARWAMLDRDGAEPYALLGAVIAQWLATGLVLALLMRLPRLWRALLSLGLVLESLLLALEAPPRPPLASVHRGLLWAACFVTGWLAVTWLLTRLTRRRAGLSAAVAVLLIPVCFVPIAYTNLPDLTCILLPSLRIAQGIPWSQIYFQYDLLPSLLGLGWVEAGGAPDAFWVLVAANYYALFLGLFLLASRLFRRPELAVPLLISALLVRFYAFDGYAAPQTAPMRLDLWFVPLLAVYWFGLSHWSVGLILGALCFLSRSISPFLVGAYGLTLVVEFWVTRRAEPSSTRATLPRALAQVARQSAPVWGGVALGLLASRLVFGSFTVTALELYRTYQIGMMRVTPRSFYWWLLALTGGAGIWVAWKRATLPSRYGQTALFAVASLLASSTYFFGRSHENNLINISAPCLFCLFFVLDLAWPPPSDGVPALRLAFRAAPWAVVAVSAYYYSGRAGTRLVRGQFRELATMTLFSQRSSPQTLPVIDCSEIARAAPERRVLFFTKDDYWYYQACHYLAPGFIQPVHLVVLKYPLVDEMSGWLHAGYKIFVPRRADWVGSTFWEFAAHLPKLDATPTEHFTVYSLAH